MVFLNKDENVIGDTVRLEFATTGLFFFKIYAVIMVASITFTVISLINNVINVYRCIFELNSNYAKE